MKAGVGILCFVSLVCGVFAEQSAGVPAADALAQFKLPDDLRLELVASEPEVVSPVAVAFDEQARMYVVENRGYPTDDSGVGLVALLEDTNNDGHYEKRTVFADGFDFPNGVMPWKGGIILTCAPNLWFLKDTDGDGKADVREVLLTGFAPGGSTQLRVSHPTLGIDNWIYLTNGLSGGEVTNPAKPDLKPVKMGPLDGRYCPLTGVFETTAGQAQFGQAFDDFGTKFVCSNRKHIEQVMLQPGDLARNPYADLSKTVAQIPDHGEAGHIYALSEAKTTAYAHAGTFTAACGLAVFRGDALPGQYRGNAFVCDPTAALVHRDVLAPNGAAFVAKRAEDNKEFLASPDNWCRPVFVTTGPDGALYVCDMYRKTIEHPVYLPEEVRAITDFEGGKTMGRIYRVIGKDTKRAVRTLKADDAAALCAFLGDLNGWVADTAQRLLLERGDATPLHDTLAKSTNPVARAKALRLLECLNALTPDEVAAAAKDSDPRVREHALRVARTYTKDAATLAALATPLANDTDDRVRFVAALVLGDAKMPDSAAALAHIAITGLDDEWTRSAVLSSIGYDIPAFSNGFLAGVPKDSLHLPDFAESLARVLAFSQEPAAAHEFLKTVFAQEGDTSPWQIAAVRGLAEGALHSTRFADAPSAFAKLEAALGDDAALIAKLNAITTRALADVGDAAQPVASRIRAAALLGFTNFDTAGQPLGALIGPIAPPELQVAAVQALGQMHDDRVAALLATDAWGGFTAPVRSAATNVLLANPQRTLALLAAIERGAVPAWTIDPGTRTRLQDHRDEAIKTKATAVFANVKTTDRKKVYEEYKDCLALAPNASSGAQVFKDACSQCHLFNGVGYTVGPDLTSIRSQPNESILMHVLMPNWLLEEGYENYTIDTTDLETFSGIIKSQNENSVTIKCPLGVEKTIPRTEITSIKTAAKSLMPEELEKTMTKQQLRDLIGYLKGEGK